MNPARSVRGRLVRRTCGILALLAITLRLCLAQASFDYVVQPGAGGARMIALADAYSASNADVMSMYANPGSLAFLRSLSASLNHVRNWSAGVISDNITVPVRITPSHTVGIGVTADHAGYQSPLPDALVQYLDYGIDLGYAARVTPTFSIGIQSGGRVVEVAGITYAAGWLSVGAFYAPSPEVSYGVRVHGLGTGMRYTEMKDTSAIETQLPLERSVEVGIEMRYPSRAAEPWFILAVASEKLLATRVTRLKGGLEVMPLEFMLLRAGYWWEEDYRSVRWGAGLKLGPFHLEYTITPGPRDRRCDAISLVYLWGR